MVLDRTKAEIHLQKDAHTLLNIVTFNVQRLLTRKIIIGTGIMNKLLLFTLIGTRVVSGVLFFLKVNRLLDMTLDAININAILNKIYFRL